MYERIYNKIFKLIKIRYVAIGISYLIYLIMLSNYLTKRKRCKNLLDISSNEAWKKISEINPKPNKKYKYNDNNFNSDIDLSIIVPVYNTEKYIEECLLSVVNQKTKYLYEVIIINDGSTDNTSKILNNFIGYKGIKIITQENKGFSGARNRGIDEAIGKYIMFLDSDDILLENAIEKMISSAYIYNVDIVQSSYQTFKENSILEIKRFIKMNKKSSDKELLFKNPGYPWAKIYRRELFEEIRFPIDLWFEDTIIHYIIFRKCRTFINISDITYGYRINQSGITATHKGKVKSLDAYWIVECLVELSKEMGLENDELIYKFTLRQLSKILYGRISCLDEEIIKNTFILACELIKQIKPNDVNIKLPLLFRDVERALNEKNYDLWITVSRYI